MNSLGYKKEYFSDETKTGKRKVRRNSIYLFGFPICSYIVEDVDEDKK